MTIRFDDLTPEEKNALELLFSHVNLPLISAAANRLIELGLAEQKREGVGISRAGEELIVQQSQKR